jgi:prophage antirepressor-like protein
MKGNQIMSNLKLITTENFGDVPCNFYRNMNDDIMLTRKQIGNALEYSDPQKAIDNIHSKHRDRLTKLSVTTKVRGTDGKEYDTTLYTERGIMEICRWSNKPKANQFMDWTWTIVEKYRNGELNNINLQPLIDTLTTLTQSMTTMQQDMTQLKESQQSLQKQIPKKKFSSWTSKMFPKYQLLMDYFDITRKELYHNLYIELQNTYPDIDISQEQDDYCFENGLDSCFTLDVIEHNKNLRMLFTQLVDSLLEKYNLASHDDVTTRRKTIFDN